MFYLTYRPKTISEIDNTKVKEILSNILQTKNLPHAFLFIGQKGTGKTSAARIFAKSVNCLDNSFSKKEKTFEPCNKCKNCLSTESSSSVDVLELDAASNRGIDDVKGLIKEANFLPMTGKYRVFIIDEAHMITNEGFNALLKTLEEPPKQVIFILATTNLEKVPKTIVSRCTLVNFGEASQKDILAMLKRILKHEKKDLPETILKSIALYSDNSFRDATKILEEVLMQNLDTNEQLLKFLGINQRDLLRIISTQDLKSTLSWVQNFDQSNGNYKNLIESLLQELRVLLLAKNGVKNEETIENLNFNLKQISLLLRLLTEAYQNLKYSPISSLPLEIALVEFYNNKS